MKIKRYDLLFLQYKSFLYKYACRLCKDNCSAEDLLQETYLHGRQSIRQLREENLFRRYLKSVMRHLNCNRLRLNWSRSRRRPGKRFHRIKGDIADNRFRPDLQLSRLETSRSVHAALDRLPDKLRTPLVLHNFRKMSYPAIASAQLIPVGTVRSRISRGKKKMRRILAIHEKGSNGRNRKEG